MSVVVIRDGIIAADTGGSMGELEIESGKLVREGDTAIGFVGAHTDGMRFIEWYFAGQDMKNLPDFHKEKSAEFSAFVLSPNGWEYWTDRFYRDLDTQRNSFMAIGIGYEVAMGAMHMGATAIQAVEAACVWISGCKLPVESESIDQLKLQLQDIGLKAISSGTKSSNR